MVIHKYKTTRVSVMLAVAHLLNVQHVYDDANLEE